VTRPLRVYLGPLAPGLLALSREAARDLLSVHRLRVGDSLVAFDPEACREADGVLIRGDQGRVACELGPVRPARVLASGITLLQSLGKGRKSEEVVRAATALGAASISFVVAERSVARPERSRAERWRAVAIEAARQSGRGDVPSIGGPVPLTTELSAWAAREARKLVLEPGATRSLLAATEDLSPGQVCVLLVGPEGGLSDEEKEQARSAGFFPVCLGPHTLRTELAPVAALGCLSARLVVEPATPYLPGGP
jgi:16S rRNA (uracil1498-N3)-methyltransferase